MEEASYSDNQDTRASEKWRVVRSNLVFGVTERSKSYCISVWLMMLLEVEQSLADQKDPGSIPQVL